MFRDKCLYYPGVIIAWGKAPEKNEEGYDEGTGI